MALEVEPVESLPLGVRSSVGNQSQGELTLQQTEELRHVLVQTVCRAGMTGERLHGALRKGLVDAATGAERAPPGFQTEARAIKQAARPFTLYLWPVSPPDLLVRLEQTISVETVLKRGERPARLHNCSLVFALVDQRVVEVE